MTAKASVPKVARVMEVARVKEVRWSERLAKRCYACDAPAVGIRDQRPEVAGIVQPACARHADPRLVLREVCMYCDGPLKSRSLDVDGIYAHKKCHMKECRS